MKLIFTQNEKTAIINSKGFEKDEIVQKMKSIGWELKDREMEANKE